MTGDYPLPTGGRVVPEAMLEDLLAMWRVDVPSIYRLPPAAPVRWTLRQRLAVRVMDLRYALAKRLYPYAFGDDL